MSLKKALATLLATVMMLSLVSCGSKSNEEAPDDASKPTESAESSGKIKVGFSSAAFSDEWCHNLALAFENLTATEYPEIEATVLDGNIDAEKQINTIQSLMQQGMDYIAVQPLPGTEPALQEVVDAGVPLYSAWIWFPPATPWFGLRSVLTKPSLAAFRLKSWQRSCRRTAPYASP